LCFDNQSTPAFNELLKPMATALPPGTRATPNSEQRVYFPNKPHAWLGPIRNTSAGKLSSND
jgi:hypothetical protein